MIQALLKEQLKNTLTSLGLGEEKILLEHPDDLAHGDYSSNIALILGKKSKRNPAELAIEIVEKLNQSRTEEVEKIEVAGAGFINFYLSRKFFVESIAEILGHESAAQNFDSSEKLKDKLVLVEYTDPNPFKLFHIGHLMSNTVGESISRIVQSSGTNVKRVCYQGDAGRHVALAIWGIRLIEAPFPDESTSLSERIVYLGKAYSVGATQFKEVVGGEEAVKLINQKIYDRSDEEVNNFYDKGREWSLEYFEEIYKKLGTKFDHYFFESAAAPRGKKLVEEFLAKGVFVESEGAVVFPEEKSGLHTRVFINSQGLPTYEAKELALAEMKYETFPYDLSIVVTANEINEYFKVLIKALEFVSPELGAKTKHVSHGILRLPTGKMSSRTGDVVTAESLLDEVKSRAKDKMKDRGFTAEELEKISEIVSVGAIKYSILKQKTGKDIIFDLDKSLSFEGDSGPYLQYAHTRAQSVLKKAKELHLAVEPPSGEASEEAKHLAVQPPSTLESLLYRFPEVVEHALDEYEPHYIATYLTEIAGVFNNFYANTQIIDPKNEMAPYNLALTKAVSIVLKNGLNLLGIQVPEKM